MLTIYANKGKKKPALLTGKPDHSASAIALQTYTFRLTMQSKYQPIKIIYYHVIR